MDTGKIKSLSIKADQSIKQAMQQIEETAERILFVTDGRDALLGTVTDGDIRRAIIKGMQLSDAVGGVMNSSFKALSASSPNLKNEAMAIMQKLHISNIPVLDEKGRIADVVTWLDCISPEAKTAQKTADLSRHKVVIMAGGKGTRLDPFTKILPKPLIPFHDKPVIEHIMDRFHKNGFSRFILVLNYKKEMIRSYLSDNALPYEIELVDESDFLGTAGGLSLLKGKINETFVVTNCDTVLEGQYADFLGWHKDRKNRLTIVGSHKEILVPYGVLSMKDGLLAEIDEKPKIDLFINTGTYIFEPTILDLISEGEHVDMDKLIERVMSKDKKGVGVYPHWGGWLDLGQWDEYRMSLKKLGEYADEL